MPKAVGSYRNWTMKLQTDPDQIDSLPASAGEVDNVPGAFTSVNQSGDFLSCNARPNVPGWDYQHHFEEAFIHKLSNHIQGVQRLRANHYAVFSGGNSVRETAHLLIAHMGSRSGALVWRSNRIHSDVPMEEDQVVLTIQANDSKHAGAGLGISPGHWHAGGISTLGDLLAVPLEGKKDRDGSVVIFYDMRDPLKPGLLNFSIRRPGQKAGTIAITQLNNGRYVLAVHFTVPERGRALDLYFSKSDKLHEGFLESPIKWMVDDVKAEGDEEADFSDYQNIEFVRDSRGGLFLIGMHNNWKLAPNPFFDGSDFIDLFRVELGQGGLADDPIGWCHPRLAKVAHRQLKSDRGQSNLDAGSGVFVTDTGELVLYACSHFITPQGRLNFSEFRCDSSVYSLTHISEFRQGWVDLFDDTRFRDRFLSVDMGVTPNLQDFNEVFVRGARFNDKVSSLKMQIPLGFELRLFRDAGAKKKAALKIPGNGYVLSIADLKSMNFNDKASAMEVVPINGN